MKKLSASKIAKIGEIIVYTLLEDAEFSNGSLYAGKSHDLLWKDIKINVKTASGAKRSRTAYNFSAEKFDKDSVYVFVGLTSAEEAQSNYFWVLSKLGIKNKSTVYLKIKDAVTASLLQERILEVAEDLKK